jgi:hypothetical protein
MRNLLLLGLGFLLGACIASIVCTALNRRSAYARGTMQVMQHHYVQLRERLRTNACADADLGPARAMLSALAEEIGPAVLDGAAPDRPFDEYTQRLRQAIAELPPSAPSCAALAPAVSRIGNACEACHQQYR